VIAAYALAGILLATSSPTPEQVRGHVERILGDKSFQTDLPGDGAAPARDDAPRPAARRRVPRRTSGALSSVSRLLLWGLVIAAACIGILWVVREFSYTAPVAGSPRGDPEEADHEVNAAVVVTPLRDADALAAGGDYSAAIHALLLKTLAELVRRTPRPIAPSLTSREILSHVDLAPEPRSALGGLVGAVEVSHFGGTEPSESDFARCRELFEAFATAYQRGAG